MTFRDALEREIATQGIAVAEVAEKSGVSKGTIYNILNGTTEDARIRVATRKALAKGCGRELEVLPDGGVVFKEKEPNAPVNEADEEIATFSLVPFCAFRGNEHCAEPFDWLYAQEEKGQLNGLKTVDRVFQQREDFLELNIQNVSDLDLIEVSLTLRVVYENGVVGTIPCIIDTRLAPKQKLYRTFFLLAGPAFDLTVNGISFLDSDHASYQQLQVSKYRYEGDGA